MQHALELFRKPFPVLRKPDAKDGADIWELVRECKPLDENSMYCNLVQCDHFRDTCVLAELNGKTAGWVSAYVIPDDPETVFVWQVAVSEDARGTGLGSLMLRELVSRDECADVTRMQTTITSNNDASWSLFRRFARSQRTKLDVQPYYTQALHFRDRHETENMVTIKLAAEARRAA
ncbi:diaminobutyrate acetyltransferase [Cribrihabitans marinus]|uniref:L-2,4-diaminobutyric acid acetyltransferase n=1 Tax=Cribrihabitans marinus TaxID=1227549 RepID=A0A1H6RLV7_9RHOB|nr:diaminobutyrate acetyltransferase [Cribrihabitans marinus]GGH20801.1 L-2,4-diaminobutyric acid acetyltransferase [Cribrihabitans marinus]SEI52770.1 diaminobutyrate acetyltransferase [Cribrihabitans marinus]